MKTFACLAIAIVSSALALIATPSHAQAWPQRTVRLVVSLGPGSGADLSARLLADRLTKTWGQPVVVENRPGGDGVVAINAVLPARDDHMLLYAPTSTFVGHPYTLEKLPYDPRDLVPVARITSTVVGVAVPASLKVQSLKELMTMVREEPGKLNWASVTGMTDIIIGGYLKGAGLDMAHVRYKDAVSALNDLVEGRIQLYSAAYAILRAQSQAGRIRVLAVQNRSRAPALPGLPTVAEEGFPGLNFDGLVGLFVARGASMPDAVRDRIAADVKAVLSDPVIAERLTSTGQLVVPGTPAEFAAAIEEQAAHLAKVAGALGMKPKQ